METLIDLFREAEAALGEQTRVQLAPGEILMREGESDDTVYVLMRGALVVSRVLGNEPTTLITIDEPGVVIGEMAALGGTGRTATVTARDSCHLIALTPNRFDALLTAHPDVAREFAAVTARRAEESDLAELLTAHFGVADGALEGVIDGAEWRHVAQGEVLFEEGDPSDAIYFVVRGRLLASRFDSGEGEEVKLGEIGRGEVVGETGLLRGTARSATVTALRDTVLAALGEDDFLDLVERRPRVMVEVCLRVLERAEDTSRSSPGTVLAVAVSGGFSVADVTRGLAAGLEPFGRVERLWAAKVDSVLGIPHVSEVEPGDLGEVRVSRLLHEAEIAADHLILDVGDRDGRWSRRCLQMADRCLIFLPGFPDADDEARIDALLDGCPNGLGRVVAMVHHPGSNPPLGTEVWLKRFDADEVIHVVEGSVDDLARLARVAAGRGNALVLGGGGGRGFAHIGVLRALTELGVPVDIVGGTSIGGILGAAIADSMSVDELTEWASNHFPQAMDYTIPMVSLIKGRRIARSARQTFGDRHIEDLWRTFFCLSTDLTAARPYLHRRGSLVRAIRATSAIPGVMPPVPHGDHLLIDGGVLNNLPIDVARDLAPAGKVVAVDVASPRGPGARRDYGLSVSGWAALRSRLGKRRRVYPGISAVLMRSMIVASMRERDSQVSSGLADCYLDLDMRGVSMLEFDDPASVAQRGYEAAMPILEGWVASPTYLGA